MEKKVLFYHGKTTDGRRFTVAGKFDGKDKDAHINIGIALCSEKDQFVKKLGRIKAEGRMNQKVSHEGSGRHSLYLYDFYKTETVLNWFVGKELQAFLEVAKDMETIDSRELQLWYAL